MIQIQSSRPSAFLGLVLYMMNTVGVLINVEAYPFMVTEEQLHNAITYHDDKAVNIPTEKESNVWKKDAKICHFDSYTDSVVMAGDVFDQYTVSNESECKSMCLQQEDFYCAAALIRSHTCYLTGFKMRRDYWSVHYVRTCTDAYASSRCFSAVSGWSAVHSSQVYIPWFVRQNLATKKIFCMALCAQSNDCVGFDLKDNKPSCYLTQMLSFDKSLKFDVHIRRC